MAVDDWLMESGRQGVTDKASELRGNGTKTVDAVGEFFMEDKPLETGLERQVGFR